MSKFYVLFLAMGSFLILHAPLISCDNRIRGHIGDSLSPVDPGPEYDFEVDSTGDEDQEVGADKAMDGICESTATTCTLRAAIAEANALAGDQAIFVPAGTYSFGAGEIAITSSLSITGDGERTTIFDGEGSHRLLTVSGGATLAMAHFSIQNGYQNGASGGGIHLASGTLSLSDCRFTNNIAEAGAGGAINSEAGNTVIINRCLFLENRSDLGGGAIDMGSGMDLTIEASQFIKNSTSGDGGAIRGGGMFDVVDTLFRLNESGAGGGAISLWAATSLTVDESLFEDNLAWGSEGGGALRDASTSTITISDSEFRGNAAVEGGAIHGGVLNLSRTLFYKNGVDEEGGAIYSSQFGASTNTWDSVTFYENTTLEQGAAVYLNAGAPGVITNIYNSTFFRNRTQSNTVPGALRLIGGANHTVNLLNNIFSENYGDILDNCSFSATVNSLGYNLSDTASGDCSTTDGTDINSTSAQLKGFLDGVFPRVLLAYTDSPAVDSGYTGCPSTDGSGRSRVDIGGVGTTTCDRGSGELQTTGGPTFLSYGRTWRVYKLNYNQTPLTPSVQGVVSGYQITPSLPSGLVFNATTGEISGAPTELSDRVEYTITASSASGSISTKINLEVLDGFVVTTNADVADATPSDTFCNTLGELDNDPCSFRAAITAANSLPGRQIILVPEDTYNLTLSAIGVSDDVVLVGQSNSGSIIDGQNANRALIFSSGVDVDVADLRFQNFVRTSVGGAFFLGSDAVARFSNLIFHGNTSSGNIGGAIASGSNNRVSIEYSFFDSNAADDGGALHISGIFFNLSHSHFVDNSAVDRGGDIYLNSYNAEIHSCTFENSSAGAEGGSIRLATNPNATIENSTFYGTSSGSVGGTIQYGGSGYLVLVNNSFVDGDAVSGGGAIDLGPTASLRAILSNNLFYSNLQGGVTADDCTTAGGSFSSFGGNTSDASDADCAWDSGLALDNEGSVAISLVGGPPVDNGGYVPTTELQLGSDGLDSALGPLCPIHDARGGYRPIDGIAPVGAKCDAGAYERQ